MKRSLYSSPGTNLSKVFLFGLISLGMAGLSAPAAAQEQVKANHILVGSKAEAERIHKDIVAGGGTRKVFSSAARKYSKDATTKVLGGSVGWFSKVGKLERSFTETAFSMPVGGLSQPIKTQFGWHLIFVTDRRDRGKKSSEPKPKAPVPHDHDGDGHPDHGEGEHSAAPKPKAPVPHDHDGDGHPDHGEGEHSATPTQPQNQLTPESKVSAPDTPPVVNRSQRRGRGFRVSLETVKGSNSSDRSFDRAFSFTPSEAIELSVIVKNQGAAAEAFFVRQLLPMGLQVTLLGDPNPIPGDFTSIAAPAELFTSLGPYDIVGQEVLLNEYWKDLKPARYSVSWTLKALANTIRTRFKGDNGELDVKKSDEYRNFRATVKNFRVTTDIVVRDPTPRGNLRRTRSMPVSVFGAMKPTGSYVAEIRFQRGPPLVIKLHSEKQFKAAKHFATLANNGFYDGLNFFEIEDGEYALGGDPTQTGTGAPAGNLPLISNVANLKHKRGTVAFVSRDVRSKGPLRGGQVGSLFVVCFKDHPEWDAQHVPFGEVVSGLEILEKPGLLLFQDVTVSTEDEQKAKPAAPAPPKRVVGNPRAVIKTAKGDLTVELFVRKAPHTVGNFITLADDGFYDKLSEGEGKQQFIYLMKDDNGPILIQTGSPTNDLEGGPGYSVPDEVNDKKHVKGALVMVAAYDENSKVIPDSAGSQFFICLKDVPYYDHQMTNTVFGKVSGSMEVLEQLAEGDEVLSVTIENKKPQPYKFKKIKQ
jgi:peptidyl-prolyl cis-trans isomerase B (cyclophilin B)